MITEDKIKQMIFPICVWLVGISFLSTYYDDFYHRVFFLMMEVPSCCLTYLFIITTNSSFNSDRIFALGFLSFQIFSLTQSIIKTYIYFAHLQIDSGDVDDLYINGLHDNTVEGFIFFSILVFISALFQTLINTKNNYAM